MFSRPTSARASITNVWGQRAAALLTSLLCISLVDSASASQKFPEGLQKELGLECAPACITCHTVPEGGLGTTNAGYGEFAKAIFPQLEDNMPAAVQIMREQDFDQDGITDADEFINNTHPGIAVPATETTPADPGPPVCATTQYGCGARIAPGASSATPLAPDSGGLLAALGIALLLTRQRRSATRARR